MDVPEWRGNILVDKERMAVGLIVGAGEKKKDLACAAGLSF